MGARAMAEGPRPKRKREEEEDAGPELRDGAAAVPFPLAELRLRRVLRESAREKAVFLHGEVPGAAGRGGGGGARPCQARRHFPR